jgi:hypothetical protein
MSSSRRIVLCARDAAVRRWVVEELAGDPSPVMVAESVSEAVFAISEGGRNQLLIVDIDELGEPELLELQTVRGLGWSCPFVGLGQVSRQLRTSLRITHVVPRPFGSEALRVILSRVQIARDTVELPKI